MTTACFELSTEAVTRDVAAHMAQCITPPMILTFQGEIGAGKTTFIRAMLRALGEQAAIKSPTFSLVESYAFDNMDVHHFDFYRLSDPGELEFIGFRDFLTAHAVCCIEWPEKAGDGLPVSDLHVILHRDTSSTSRKMVVEGMTSKGKTLLRRLEKI